jgi:hypothetical protein
VRDDRDDLSRKMGAFDGEVAIAVAQLYLVHVFQRSIPAEFLAPCYDHENSRIAINSCTIYAG